MNKKNYARSLKLSTKLFRVCAEELLEVNRKKRKKYHGRTALLICAFGVIEVMLGICTTYFIGNNSYDTTVLIAALTLIQAILISVALKIASKNMYRYYIVGMQDQENVGIMKDTADKFKRNLSRYYTNKSIDVDLFNKLVDKEIETILLDLSTVINGTKYVSIDSLDDMNYYCIVYILKRFTLDNIILPLYEENPETRSPEKDKTTIKGYLDILVNHALDPQMALKSFEFSSEENKKFITNVMTGLKKNYMEFMSELDHLQMNDAIINNILELPDSVANEYGKVSSIKIEN